MELESGSSSSFSTCLRHPSQIFTGICSFCLAERLASVGSSAERSSNLSGRRGSEIVEIDEAESSSRRVRRTLSSLFELDDRVERESELSSSSSVVIGDVSNGSGRVSRKLDPDVSGDECLKDRGGGSVWLRWRGRRGPSKKRETTPEQSSGVEIGDGSPEVNKHNFRHSCDWNLCRDPGRASWEVPRHSWDGGSMVSKAFACSFACIEEPQDGSRRVRWALPQGATAAEPVPPVADKIDVGKVDSASSIRESHQGVSVPGISRKKSSHRWSRVWDWSITSPFRDLAKKREHVLERSLSESWREGRKDKDMETAETLNRIHLYTNGHNSARSNQSLNRSINAVNGELHNFRLDSQKKKESRFGRSRSVHYSSPGNLDNGLLRFYLTPLRSSRRSTTKGRMRNSHSFARSILGLH